MLFEPRPGQVVHIQIALRADQVASSGSFGAVPIFVLGPAWLVYRDRPSPVALVGVVIAVAGGAILTSLMPGLFSFRTGMLITAMVFVGITLIGGFWAAGLTNVINVLVIYVGIVLGAGLTVGKLGGLSALGVYLWRRDRRRRPDSSDPA